MAGSEQQQNAPAEGQGQINLMDLSLEQLNSLKSQLEQELQQLTTSFGGLREAQVRFKESKDSLETLNDSNLDKQILVPLTASMFVPGKISNVKEVLLDVGTGYFVEQSVEDAKKFMDRKVSFLQSNTDSLKEVLEGKRNMLEGVVMVMQQKLRMADRAQ
jgi:prefoldin alpha subunit